MKDKPTETQLVNIGFDFVKSYNHDEWYTRRHKKGVIQAEFTYKSEADELETFDIVVDETCIEPTIDQMAALDKILNKRNN